MKAGKWIPWFILSYIAQIGAKHLPEQQVIPTRVKRAWRPPAALKMTEEVFYNTFGLGHGTYARMQSKAARLRTITALNNDFQVPSEPMLSSLKFDDVIFPESMLDYLIQSAENMKARKRRRKKRKVLNFENAPNMKWPYAYIPYVLDKHSGHWEDTIRQAIAHWEDETCIRFYEVNTTSRPDYIVFTDFLQGCYANYGRTGFAQVINLGPTCFRYVGTSIHEIGHALGFYHEHSRYDRSAYVTVLHENVKSGEEQNFAVFGRSVINTYNIPYDYSSVMHYSTKSFSVESQLKKTLTATNPLYEHTMGQRLGLSFLDTMAANIAYCAEVCRTPTISCFYGGYPDPNDCMRCKCPTGFSGTLCGNVAPSSDTAVCAQAGTLRVTSMLETCIRVGPYTSGTSCNWLLRADVDCKIKFWLRDDFDVLCSEVSSGPTCLHYVEVRHQNNLQNGPRFCCSFLPDFDFIISDASEMMIIFRSPQSDVRQFEGFTMCYSAASCLSTTTSTTEIVPALSTTSGAPAPRDTGQPYSTSTWHPPYTVSTYRGTTQYPGTVSSHYSQAQTTLYTPVVRATTTPWWPITPTAKWYPSPPTTQLWYKTSPLFTNTPRGTNVFSSSGTSRYSTTTSWLDHGSKTTSWWWIFIQG